MEGLVVTTDTGESIAIERLKLNREVAAHLSGDGKPESVIALGEAVTISTEFADQYLQHGNEETATAFIRMGHVLNQLGKQVDAFSRSFAHSFAQELHRDAKALLSDPIGFAQEEIISLGHGIKQATLLTLRFGAACHRIMSSEPEEAERLIRTYTRKIGEKLTILAQHLTAEKLGELTGRFAGGKVLRRYRTRILGAMTSSTEIAYLAKQADVLAAAVKANAGLKLAEKSGAKKVNKTVAQLEKDAERVAGSKNVVKEVEKDIRKSQPTTVGRIKIPDYIKDNRIPLDRETILVKFKKTKITPVKGAQVYQSGDKFYHRDTLHKGKGAHLEVYDKRGNHLGEANPLTGELVTGTLDKTKKLNLR